MQLDALDDREITVTDSLRTVTARQRQLANLRPRQKGQPSLNPGGRPKKEFELAAEAQQHARLALATLVKVMQDEKATPASRVSAASEVLDRAYGRAPQSIKMKTEVSFPEQFEEFVRQLNARRVDSPSSTR